MCIAFASLPFKLHDVNTHFSVLWATGSKLHIDASERGRTGMRYKTMELEVSQSKKLSLYVI